jgi:hypothetical protein
MPSVAPRRPRSIRVGLAMAALFAFGIAPIQLSHAQPATEPRLALVIGNASYKNSPLGNPVNDARLMEAALKESGFQVIKAENATIREMRRLVREFGERLKASGGVGLFYFAGHGVQVNGENFLVSVDSDIRHEDEVADDAVNAQVVLEKMQAAGNRMNLIVLDACRNNPFAVKSRTASNGLATMNAPSGSMVAYATAPGSVASDGSGANGLYTQHLARIIRQPGLQVEEVFKQVRTAVRRDSGNRQTPWENTALEGQFFFKPPVLAAVSPSVVPNAVSPIAPVVPVVTQRSPAEQRIYELAAWDRAKASNDTADLQNYIDGYPQGDFVNEAKTRIVLLHSRQPAMLGSGPASAGAGRFTGRLTIRDDYSGRVLNTLDVVPSGTSGGPTRYTTGDVIGPSGEVLAVRFGSYVGEVKSGALWKIPLQAGASGRAMVQLQNTREPAEFVWRVTEKNAAESRIEADFTLIGLESHCRTGTWSARYAADAPFPFAASLIVRIRSDRQGTGDCGPGLRLSTQWQPGT